MVTADGMLQPCSMQFKRYPLEERARMIEEFTTTNTCDECYVSIRSYLDKIFPALLWENVSGFFSFKTPDYTEKCSHSISLSAGALSPTRCRRWNRSRARPGLRSRTR